MCNGISPNATYDAPTAREKELIQKLEEATGEIEALLMENEKLIKMLEEREKIANEKVGEKDGCGVCSTTCNIF